MKTALWILGIIVFLGSSLWVAAVYMSHDLIGTLNSQRTELRQRYGDMHKSVSEACRYLSTGSLDTLVANYGVLKTTIMLMQQKWRNDYWLHDHQETSNKQQNQVAHIAMREYLLNELLRSQYPEDERSIEQKVYDLERSVSELRNALQQLTGSRLEFNSQHRSIESTVNYELQDVKNQLNYLESRISDLEGHANQIRLGR